MDKFLFNSVLFGPCFRTLSTFALFSMFLSACPSDSGTTTQPSRPFTSKPSPPTESTDEDFQRFQIPKESETEVEEKDFTKLRELPPIRNTNELPGEHIEDASEYGEYQDWEDDESVNTNPNFNSWDGLPENKSSEEEILEDIMNEQIGPN